VTPKLRIRALRDLRPFANGAEFVPSGMPTVQVVPRLMKKLGLEQRLWESHLFQRWAEIVGKAAAQYTQPYSLKNGQLIVHVPHPAYIQELRSTIPDMLAAIHQRFGPASVRKIVLRVG